MSYAGTIYGGISPQSQAAINAMDATDNPPPNIQPTSTASTTTTTTEKFTITKQDLTPTTDPNKWVYVSTDTNTYKFHTEVGGDGFVYYKFTDMNGNQVTPSQAAINKVDEGLANGNAEAKLSTPTNDWVTGNVIQLTNEDFKVLGDNGHLTTATMSSYGCK